MTREQAARHYLEVSRAASIAPRGSEKESESHLTMRELEKRHPHVKRHAIVGLDKDFDQPLGRNEREHQAELRRQSGLTSQQVNAQRQELRAHHYGFPNPSEIYDAANPEPEASRRARGSRRHTSRRRARSAGRKASRVASTATATPVKTAGGIAGELLVAGLALSLLYMLLKSEEPGGTHIVTTTLKGLTGALGRLVSPASDLFTPAPLKTTRVKSVVPSAPRAGVSSPAALAQHNRDVRLFFGPLPNFATVTPTIP